MPNHWESSGRPLFVKTVFVNGNRHAILNQEDPLHRNGVYSLKKQSRPSSSLSVSSILSTVSSESQEIIEGKNKLRPESNRKKQRRDISAQLQGCLIKLKLTSNIKQKRSKSKDDEVSDQKQEETNWKRKTDSELPEQRKKGSGNKANKNFWRYQGGHVKKSKSAGNENGNHCYFYNLKNHKRKKSYCFVKITSKSPHIILNCSCEENWGKTHGCCDSKDYTDKNKLVISATFHNLVMTADGKEKISNDSNDYLFSVADSDSYELYWNNYFTKSCYNSLSERVIQWLNLASKWKNNEDGVKINREETCLNESGRIFVKRSLNKNSESKNNVKCPEVINGTDSIRKEKEKTIQKEASEEDVTMEVKSEINIETALSVEKFQNIDQENVKEVSVHKNNFDSEQSTKEKISKIETQGKKIDNHKISNTKKNNLVSSKSDSLENTISNSFGSFLITSDKNIEGLPSKIITEEQVRDSYIQRNLSSSGEQRSGGIQIKYSEFDDGNQNFKITGSKCWEKIKNQTNSLVSSRYSEECENRGEELTKNRNWLQELEKFEKASSNNRENKSINQYLNSSQQNDKSDWLKESKKVWSLDKNLGKPQLHIFIPSITLREQNDDNISECDSFFGEIY